MGLMVGGWSLGSASSPEGEWGVMPSNAWRSQRRSAMSEEPQPYPVRPKGDKWEVLVPDPEKWIPCDSEDDALIIAYSPVLEHQIRNEGRNSEKDASDCQKTAKVLEKYGLRRRAAQFQRLYDGAAFRLVRKQQT
jgi:hypothetical protein